MPRRRFILLAALAAATFVPLVTIAAYGWYWRSARYRNYCANVLSRALELPADIGKVVPRSLTAREFRDVRVWLPHRRGQAASCATAILRRVPTGDDPEAYELDLRDGRTEVSTRTWLREDYRFVLESSLRPGFAPGGPRRVVFSGMDVALERDRFRAELTAASGVVTFTDPHHGRAWARCREFNGHPTPRDVSLEAEFSPLSAGIRLDRVQLIVPEMPVSLVGLRELAGMDLHTGSFGGRVIYRELAPPGPAGDSASCDLHALTVQGRLADLSLAEFTETLFPRPWRGTATELEIEDLSLVNGRLEHVRLRGVLSGVELGDVLAPWGFGGVGGHLQLRLRVADVTPNGIAELIVAGRAEGIDLSRLSPALGWGELSGNARIALEDLTVRENRLASMRAEFTVIPSDEDKYIGRDLVATAVERLLGVSLPGILLSRLPERIPYAQLGVRVEIHDEMLTVFGTHGSHDGVILSVMLSDQEIPVVYEPTEAYDLREPLDNLRQRLLPALAQHLQTLTPADAWQAIATRRSQAASAPASQPAPPGE